jgi:hypothetical protein
MCPGNGSGLHESVVVNELQQVIRVLIRTVCIITFSEAPHLHRTLSQPQWGLPPLGFYFSFVYISLRPRGHINFLLLYNKSLKI